MSSSGKMKKTNPLYVLAWYVPPILLIPALFMFLVRVDASERFLDFLILLLVLAVLLVVYAGVVVIGKNQEKSKQKEEEAKKIYVTDLGKLSEIQFDVGNGEIQLVKEDGTWYDKNDKDFPLAQSYPKKMEKTFRKLEADRKLEDGDSLEAYGLEDPAYTVVLTDQDGNVVSRHDATPIRQVISAETSALVRDIMEYEVTTGTGKNGQVAGYRIGGKTGTADKVGGNVIVSFVCFAPADDPQVMMLLTLDEPNKWTGTYVSGGNMVAPVASSVMGEILPYLGIEPSYTAEELVGADKTVPNVVGLSKDAAAERLSANGFSFRTVGSGDTVTDQTPAGGAIVPNSAEIILYLGAEKSGEKCIVPNVVGDSAATANQKIVNAGLIMGVSGATNASSSTVRAISQSIAAGTEVEAGTVVRVQFSDSSVRD